MARRHSPAEQYRQAKQMALDYNLSIDERPGRCEARYYVFSKTTEKRVLLGHVTGVDGLFRLVSKLSQ